AAGTCSRGRFPRRKRGGHGRRCSSTEGEMARSGLRRQRCADRGGGRSCRRSGLDESAAERHRGPARRASVRCTETPLDADEPDQSCPDRAERGKGAPMLIVDAQIHLWNAGNPTTPAPRQVPSSLQDQALAEMDAGGVDAAVLPPPLPWDPQANELALEAARQHPDRFVVLGSFPLDKPESRALVDTWKQRPGRVGLRFVFPPTEQRQG